MPGGLLYAGFLKDYESIRSGDHSPQVRAGETTQRRPRISMTAWL
jgi:hypothetical protein